MNMISKERRQAAAVPLAAVLYPDTNLPAADGSADHSQHVEGLGRPLDEASRGGVLSRLLHGVAAWVAAWHEHRAVLDQLSAMSDRDLADIGLTRRGHPSQVVTAASPGGVPLIGSQGGVETANSLPRGASKGTVTCAQQQAVQRYLAKQQDGQLARADDARLFAVTR
ncbi:MAG: DUF1127 domain-containing protein [Acetobacteraceae bacterium]|nr:DUF1127 domain-containing protein [Acetobacteraceae bacterium]